jgi:tetratricopeptide (TPR) repeat protein
MKRFSLNFILIIAFALLLSVIILPFAAEAEFGKAKRLEENYRWRKAGEVYQQAVRLDPFNAGYSAGYGDFLMRQSQYHKDKSEWLKKAEGLYERACRLNPGHAEYRFSLGKVKLQLKDVDSGLEDFRTAIELDPYNFRINYYIGHNLISVWKSLDIEWRNFAADRLSYVLRLRPSHAEHVYPAIMYYTRDFSIAENILPETLIACEKLYYFIRENNLWQFRKQVRERLDFYREKEDPVKFKQEKEQKQRLFRELRSLAMTGKLKGWAGESKGGDVYKNGNIYWEGTVNAAVDVPAGKTTIYLMAKGSAADGIYPYMIVELDGEGIGERFVDSAEWKEYPFEVDTDGGVKVLSVTFVNDGGNEEKSEDRNLYIGKVAFKKQEKNEQQDL